MKRAKANMVYGCDYSDVWISGFKGILRSFGFELNFSCTHQGKKNLFAVKG